MQTYFHSHTNWNWPPPRIISFCCCCVLSLSRNELKMMSCGGARDTNRSKSAICSFISIGDFKCDFYGFTYIEIKCLCMGMGFLLRLLTTCGHFSTLHIRNTGYGGRNHFFNRLFKIFTHKLKNFIGLVAYTHIRNSLRV